MLKADGRLVVGEVLALDSDAVRFGELCSMAGAEGFALERRLGPRFAYFARFIREASTAAGVSVS